MSKKLDMEDWEDLARLRQRVEAAKEQQRMLKEAKMQEDIDLMEGFYRAAIKQAEKILNSVGIGEIIHVHEHGKRFFEVVSKESTMNVRVKDVKTGQILKIYANQIEKIDKKPEMLEILYEKP